MNATSTLKSERMSRMGLLAEPAGYVEGANLYEYVGGDPVNEFDPLGLYKIDWHSGSNWTAAEKQRILDSLQRVKARSDVIVPQIDNLIANLKKRACDMSAVVSELDKLKNVLKKESAGIASGTEKLEFVKKFFNKDASLRHQEYRIGTNNIEYNMQADKMWDKLALGILDQAHMHELSHQYGTEDDDSKGLLMNAHTLDQLMGFGQDIGKWFPVKRLVDEAQKKCGPCGT